MNKKNIVQPKQTGKRLNKFLAEKFPELSRAFIKEQIKTGAVLVNEKTVKPSHRLKENDIIMVNFPSSKDIKILPNPEIILDIIYEDKNVIVIDKPAGLSVHPRQDKNGRPLASELNNTLVSGLLAHYPDIAGVGDIPTIPSSSPLSKGEEKMRVSSSPFQGEGWPARSALACEAGGGGVIRSGLVHRLDKDTSGVMIVAKNQPSFDWLKKQFQERKVEKKYIALLVGRPKEKQGMIKNLLVRSASDPTKQKALPYKSLLPSDEGRVGWGDKKISNTTPSQSPPQLRGRGIREAITKYKVLKEFRDFTLIEARPKTGRLHQIRVQLATLGLPVAGDTKYGPKKRPRPASLNRQFLHAQELKIILPASPDASQGGPASPDASQGGPDGLKKVFAVPLPSDLTAILKGLDPHT